MALGVRPDLEALPAHPLLQETTGPAGPARLSAVQRTELEQLAAASDSLQDRSERLYGWLRKRIGQPDAAGLLKGVLALALAGEVAGCRLLAALMDVHAPGSEMVARIHRFVSCRRVARRLRDERTPTSTHRLWLGRFEEVRAVCEARAAELSVASPTEGFGTANEPPFPLLRRWLEELLALLALHGDLEDADKQLLVGLARVEVDAYEERVSRLASEVDPYRTSAVMRVLPMLSQADSEIRAMRDFIQSLEAEQAGAAFRQRQPRVQELLDGGERERLLQWLEATPDLLPLARLFRGVVRKPIPMRRLAGTTARLMTLAGALRSAGMRSTPLDLVAAVEIAQRFESDGELRLPLGGEMSDVVGKWLSGALAAAPGDPLAAWPRDGFRLEAGTLLLRVPDEGRSDRPWRDDLPALLAKPDDQEPQADVDATAAELKRLVLANLDNVSVTLGFLQNARVVGIPGLVAAIAVRCRSLRVLDLIATDKRLHSGFSNKDVPRALLLSPCNIPVKSLSKFIHAKYVNKVDLQRMAKDKTGMRREVIKEIERYLASLAA